MALSHTEVPKFITIVAISVEINDKRTELPEG